MQAEKRTEMAFVFAESAIKQLITLSTAVIAFTVTFSKDFDRRVPSAADDYVRLSWLAFMASIVLGHFALLSITGLLASQDPKRKLEVNSGAIMALSCLQTLAFLVGMGLQVAFAFAQLKHSTLP